MENKRILLVDDDADDRDIFLDALKGIDEKIECTCVGGWSEGLQFLEKNLHNLPDFIFLDLNMPRISGKEALKEIQSHEKLKHIHVVIYTTSASKEDKIETEKMGGFYFLTKHNKFKDLKKELAGLLQRDI